MMDVESSQNNTSNKLIDLERRVNKYEREITYLKQKNETINSKLNKLEKERENYDDSVKDMKKELVEKKQLCDELDSKLQLSQKNSTQLQETYRKLLNDKINNQKLDEIQKLVIQIEKQKEQLEIQKDEMLRADREKENLQESIELLTQQIQSMKQAELNKQNLISQKGFSSNFSTISQGSTIESTSSNILASNGASFIQGIDLSASPQISSYTIQITNLKSSLEAAKKDADDNKLALFEFKKSMNELLLKSQQQVTDRDTSVLEKIGEIESLKDQIKTLKEQIDQDITDKHDLKQNYELNLNKQKGELHQLQFQLENKEKFISQLQEQIGHMGQKNIILENSTISTEDDGIRELTLKNQQIQKEHTAISEKNRLLQAQLDYLQRDLKQKLPILNLRKNEYSTMHSNYQGLKDKLALSIKNANSLQEDKQLLLKQIEQLIGVKDQSHKKLNNIEQDNLYLNFLLNKLKKVVVERNSLDGVNLVHYNIEYIKQVGVSEQDKNEYEQMCNQYNEQKRREEDEEESKENQSMKNFVKQEEYNRLLNKYKQNEEECKKLSLEVAEYKDKIEKLEQMDTIRFKILGEANQTISMFNSNVQKNELLEKEREKRIKVEEDRDYFKKEYNKSQFELSRLSTEQEIIKEMIEQVQTQANLYSSKYEQILKSQLKENTAFEQSRIESKKLRLQLLEIKVKNESLNNENNRLNSQIEFLRKQIKQETQNYMDALKKKSFYLDRDQKSAVELKNLRAKVTELSTAINEIKEKNQLEVEIVQSKFNEQSVSFQQQQVHYNILIENLKLLTQHSTTKIQTLNKILQDQEKEIMQLKSKQHMLMFDENGEQIQDPLKDMMVDENFVRLDTQFLKNLNKMEQIVQDQKEEHQKSIQKMQNTLEELAEKCLLLSDKLKQAEKLDEQNTKTIKSLEVQHIQNLDKKEKEYTQMLQEKQTQYEEIDKRFEEYRKEQSKVQQDIINKMQQEQQIQSENDESSFKIKRLADEKDELAIQLKEIKEYLGELASERLIIESANQNEMEFYINQVNRKQQQLLKAQENVSSSSKMEIEETTQTSQEQGGDKVNEGESADSQQTLLKKINDENMIYKYEHKITELQSLEETLRIEKDTLASEKTSLEQELSLLRSSLIEKEKEVAPTEEIAELKKKQIEEMQELQTQFKSEKQVLVKQIEHLSQFNKKISSEEAFNINLMTQDEGFLDLMEKLSKLLELQANTRNVQNNGSQDIIPETNESNDQSASASNEQAGAAQEMQESQ